MGQMSAHTAGQPWVYPVTLTTNSHNVVFNTENKFLDADIKAEITVNDGSITPVLDSTNLGTYFNPGTSSSNSISLTPKATTTAGFIPEFDASAPKTGTTSYYSIITTTPSFTGGALTGKTASADFSSYITADTTTTNGISFTAKGTAGRAAVTYTNTAGWLVAHASATNASGAVSASTWNGAVYYITKIVVPKAKNFLLDTEANTGTDSSTVTITNNAYRRINITNKGITTVTSGSNALGTLSVAAYSSSSDTATPTAQAVVTDGVWETHSQNPTTSAQGPFYGKTTITAVSQTNLSAGNIKAGVTVTVKGGSNNIYNVAGTFTSDANATAGQILKDKTAYVNGSKVTGTMPNNGALGGTITTQNGTYTIPAGYTTGGTVTAKFTVVSVSTPTWSKDSSNIVTAGRSEWGTGYISANHLDAATFANSGTNGVKYLDLSNGKKDSSTYIIPEIPAGGKLYINRGYIDNICIDLARLIPDASAVNNLTGDYILTGHSAYDNAGNLVVGSIPFKAAATYTPTTSNQTIAAGQYLSGAQTIAGDADLVASNIRKGVNIFNVTGTYSTVTGNNITALTAASLRSGYAGFANGGNQINGTMPDITVTSSITASANMTGKYFTTSGASSSSYDVSLTPQYTNDAIGYLGVAAGTHNGTVQYYKIITATFTGNGGNVTLTADTTSNSIYKSASNTGNVSVVDSAPATDSGYLYIKVTGSGTAKANKAGWIELNGATATGSSDKYIRLLGYDGTYTIA